MPSEATVDRNAVWVAPSKPDLEIEVTTLPPIFVVGERADRYRLVKLLDGRHGIDGDWSVHVRQFGQHRRHRLGCVPL